MIIAGAKNPYNNSLRVVLWKLMFPRPFLRKILIITGISVVFCFSCTSKKQLKDTQIFNYQCDLPPAKEIPPLRILDYKNRKQGAALSPWLQRYLENGIEENESLDAYNGSYLFIASVRSAKQSVINHWMANYFPDRDFPRLAALRIQKRLELDISGRPPDLVYGPNYEKTLKAAYGNSFWGAARLDETWILAHEIIQDDETIPSAPVYWGFILVSIPRETLEIQIIEMLSKINPPAVRGSTAAREQNAAFDHVKEHFFVHF